MAISSQHKLSSCTGKESFARWELAERVAKRMRRCHDSATTPYLCKLCGNYHVGSDEHRMRQQRRLNRKTQQYKQVRLSRSDFPNMRYRLSFWSRIYS